jgi:hypothetical protein
MTIVELTDTQRPRERETMRRAAHFGRRCDNVHVTYFLQGFLELDQPIGMDTVIVCDQNPNHTFISPGSLTQERPILETLVKDDW